MILRRKLQDIQEVQGYQQLMLQVKVVVTEDIHSTVAYVYYVEGSEESEHLS